MPYNKPMETSKGRILCTGGTVVSYGEVFGRYHSERRGDHMFTSFNLRGGKHLQVIGEYVNSKYDGLSSILFLELAHDSHSYVVAVNFTGSANALCKAYNRLYMISIAEHLPVNLEISDNMVIASWEDAQSLVTEIKEFPDRFEIKGYGDELLKIPRPINNSPPPATSMRMSEDSKTVLHTMETDLGELSEDNSPLSIGDMTKAFGGM